MGYGIAFFPFSWRFGPWVREKKTLFAIGPFRLVVYKNPGEWKSEVLST
jgi:hypothetical protein